MQELPQISLLIVQQHQPGEVTNNEMVNTNGVMVLKDLENDNPTKQWEENHEQGWDLYNSSASNSRQSQQTCVLTSKQQG